MKTTLETIEVVWRGVGDLMVHNGQLANPLNSHTRKIKALSSKRKKTDEDLVDLAKAEFIGSFYWDDRFGPVMPTNNILATLVNGAKKSKYGREAGLAVFVEGTPKTGDAGVVRIDYDGPRDLEKLWDNGKSRFINSMLVRVQASRVVRTRPVLPAWSLHFIVKFDSSVLNRETVIKAMEDAGFYIGLAEYRPRWGRFEVEVIR